MNRSFTSNGDSFSLADVFDTVDTDNNGVIDVWDELPVILRAVGLLWTPTMETAFLQRGVDGVSALRLADVVHEPPITVTVPTVDDSSSHAPAHSQSAAVLPFHGPSSPPVNDPLGKSGPLFPDATAGVSRTSSPRSRRSSLSSAGSVEGSRPSTSGAECGGTGAVVPSSGTTASLNGTAVDGAVTEGSGSEAGGSTDRGAALLASAVGRSRGNSVDDDDDGSDGDVEDAAGVGDVATQPLRRTLRGNVVNR